MSLINYILLTINCFRQKYPLIVNLTFLLLCLHPPSGMLPVVSTRPLSNFELTLSHDGTRVGNHRCSNLLDFTEVKTHYSFLTEATKNPEVIGETAPYQYSTSLRGSSTLRFYRNLNLEACLWEFSSYYDMSELLSDCGGTIGTDGQVSSPTFEPQLTSDPLLSFLDMLCKESLQ